MSLTPARHAELKRYAIQLRRLVVESVHHAGAGHLGGRCPRPSCLSPCTLPS